MIKAVAFDVDGVLIDSNNVIVEAYRETAKKLRLRAPSPREILDLMGRPLGEIVGILWPNANIELYTKEYRRLFTNEELIIPSVEGAPDAVRKIKKFGYRIGVISGKIEYFIRKHLKEAGFDMNLFEFIGSFETTEKHNPDPEPLLHAISKLEVKPEEIVYVGDAIADYECANNAKVEYIAVLTGSLKRQKLQELEVKNIIDSVVDLPMFLRLINQP